MVSGLWADGTGRLLQESLTGLARRQRLIATNVANMDTPGYRPTDLKFEQVLGQHVRAGSGNRLASTSPLHMSGYGRADTVAVDQMEASGVDAERVDADYEMARLSETVIEYNAVAQLISSRLAILRSAVTEGRK